MGLHAHNHAKPKELKPGIWRVGRAVFPDRLADMMARAKYFKKLGVKSYSVFTANRLRAHALFLCLAMCAIGSFARAVSIGRISNSPTGSSRSDHASSDQNANPDRNQDAHL